MAAWHTTRSRGFRSSGLTRRVVLSFDEQRFDLMHGERFASAGSAETAPAEEEGSERAYASEAHGSVTIGGARGDVSGHRAGDFAR